MKTSSFGLFDHGNGFVDPYRMFYANFLKVCSRVIFGEINVEGFRQWIENQSNFSFDVITWDGFDELGMNIYSIESMYIEKQQEIVIHIVGDSQVRIFYSIQSSEQANVFINEAIKFVPKPKAQKDHNLYVVVPDSRGELELTYLKISKPDLRIQVQYNDDLFSYHSSIVSILNEYNKSGIMLFHGVPGTGKSTYIRYLLHLTDKRVIFMSPFMVSTLDTPKLTKLLTNNPNTIFVMEDAEELIVSRENSKTSSISTLLNLTDGLLGNALGIQFIATFNIHVTKIDQALLRKGRLLKMYEFKPLSIEKSQNLNNELGNKSVLVDKPMTLADIYHTNE